MAEPRSRARRLFWPVVLLGIAGSGLAAIAGSKDWKSLGLAQGAAPETAPQLDNPATTALALVALAAWGVLLVTRGRIRRALAILGALAALGAAITTSDRPDASGVSSFGQTGTGQVTGTAWPWIALVASVMALAAAVAAFFFAPHWPEMGRKYDAPTTGPQLPANLDEAESIDLWKSISEGRDPTAGQD